MCIWHIYHCTILICFLYHPITCRWTSNWAFTTEVISEEVENKIAEYISETLTYRISLTSTSLTCSQVSRRNIKLFMGNIPEIKLDRDGTRFCFPLHFILARVNQNTSTHGQVTSRDKHCMAIRITIHIVPWVYFISSIVQTRRNLLCVLYLTKNWSTIFPLQIM